MIFGGRVRSQLGGWGSNFYIEIYRTKNLYAFINRQFFLFTANIKYTKFTNEA